MITDLGVYSVIPYLFPGFIAMTILGWAIFLQDVKGDNHPSRSVFPKGPVTLPEHHPACRSVALPATEGL